MAEEWVNILVSLAIGLGGGLVTGVVTNLVGRVALKRRIKNELENYKLFRDTQHCLSCKRKIPIESAFCAFCGIPVGGTKACELCRIALPEKAVYCYICQGHAVYKELMEDKPTKAKDKNDQSD
ncbi:MAG: hypothetical protein FK732_03500 [Asgard group archaeon]|nr:hypothetical protein [Asgard group archaeon]